MPRRAAAAVLALAALALLATSARAELKVGDVPEPLGADAAFVKGDAVTLEQLRGKVVALQLAHTRSDPCKEQLEKLHELRTKYGEKGLVVLWVFEEGSDAVEAFVKEVGPSFAVVAGVRDLRERWGLMRGFPTTYVLDVEGKVAWAGNFADRADIKIDGLVRKVIDRPWLPAKYAVITKDITVEKYAAARKGLMEALAPKTVDPDAGDEDPDAEAGDKLSDDDRKRLEAAVAWLDGIAAKVKEQADARRDEGVVYLAYKAYRELVEQHAGSPAAESASAEIEGMLADQKKKREIEGGVFFEESFEQAKQIELKDRRRAIALLKKVVSRYRGTWAAGEAKRWVDKLED